MKVRPRYETKCLGKALTFGLKYCIIYIRLVASTFHKLLTQKLAFVDFIYQERRVMANLG